MSLIKDYQSGGVLISDEKVVCDEAVVISAVTYYKGFLAYLPLPSLSEANNANVGVYTTVGHGVQLTVLTTGVPADATSVVVDMSDGSILSTVVRTFAGVSELFVDYYGITSVHNRFLEQITFNVPEILISGDAYTDLRTAVMPYYAKFGFVGVDVWGQLPDSAGTFVLQNSATGGDSVNVPISNTDTSVMLELTDPFKTTDIIVLSTTDGLNVQGVDIRLYGF